MIGSWCGRVVVYFLVLAACSGLISPPSQCQAAFDVHEDAFSISNAPGWCFAMAAFARWYYLTQQDAAPLRRVLDQHSQQRIARELQRFYSQNLVKIQADYCNQRSERRMESFRRFLVGLAAGEPRIVLLMSRGTKGVVLHAVLAFAWVPEKHIIKVYDPNYCNQERSIDLERKEYTSLDITYNALCFPEVLHNNPGLVKKMESLLASCAVDKRTVKTNGPVARPLAKRVQLTRPSTN
jgi:hypothetical protein